MNPKSEIRNPKEVRISNSEKAASFGFRDSAFFRDSGFGIRIFLVLALLLAGCATPRTGANRPFQFEHDTFAFANELEWDYTFNPATGKMDHRPRQPEPEFAQRCFPVVITARKFFYHARFDPALPRATTNEYRRLAKSVVSRSQRVPSPEAKKAVIPGYDGLFAFSRDYEAPLKAACGGKWQSYVQRGNWRMIFPFSRSGQKAAANQLLAGITSERAPIVHIVTFPSLAMNHVMLLYEAEETGAEIRFRAYDPNTPGQPAEVIFDRSKRSFVLPRTAYFQGGPVNVYEIYRDWRH
jgi:hypothetical protein